MGFGLDSMGKSALNNRQVINKKLSEATARLSSGYRVNSSADDPAGLAISEKLRSIDRGLRQGVRNISDGLNYIDTVDSASQQVHNMLHRLKEIAVEAANGTNQRIDREALDLEYQQILDEIGQIADNSDFNGLPLFEPHQPTFTTFEGGVVHNSPITIDDTKTPLYVSYSTDGVSKQISIHIPYGTYTADEVADMIDDFLIESEPNLIIGVDEHNHFTIQSENGHISSISGPGASLFYDTTIGNADGYLLGVTLFDDNDSAGSLPIFEGINDTMKFRLGNADDTVYTIVLPPRSDDDPYTRPELLDEINGQLKDLGISDMVKAIPYVNEDGKNIIGFSSKKPVTGLGGNFLLLDSKSSPLYDIAKHCNAVNTNATLDGARNVNGLEILRDRNDWFDLKVSYYVGDEQSVVRNDLRITLLGEGEDRKTYASASDVADEIQRQLSEKGVPVKVVAKPNGTLGFTSEQYGDKCSVAVDTVNVPSGYMLKDIFDYGELLPLTGRSDSSYYPAYSSGKRDISGGVEIGDLSKRLTYEISTDNNGKISLNFDLDSGKYSQSQIKSTLQNKLNDLINNTYPELKGSLEFEIGTNITLKATDSDAGKHVTNIGVQSSGAYRQLIGGATYTDNAVRVEGTELPDIEYRPSSPTGGQNIIEVPGQSNADSVSYSSGSNTSSSGVKDGAYITYSEVPPALTKGDGKRIEGDPTHYTDSKPATMKISNVRSLFADNGKLAEDATLSFTVDGRPCNITLKKGTSDSEAVGLINSQIKGATVKWGSADNPDNPNANDLMFTSDAQKPTVEFTNVSGTLLRNANIAAGAKREGAVIDVDKNTYSVPPLLTLGSVKSHMPLTVNGLNDNLVLSVGSGKPVSITIPNGTYDNAGSLAGAINDALKGSGFSVKASGDNIVITGDLNMSGAITIGGNTHLNQRKTVYSGGGDRAGSLTVNGVGTNLPMTFPQGNYIQFTYSDGDDPSKSQTFRVDLGGKNLSMSGLVQEIRNQVGTDKVSVSYSGDKLTITTVGKGDGYAVTGFTTNTTLDQTKIDNTNTPNSEVAGDKVLTYGRLENSLFGGLFTTGGGLEINNSNDNFEVIINGGNRVNVKLTHGLYTSAEGILSQIRSAVSAAGGKVEVVSGRLVISTADGGNGKRVEIGSGNTSPLFKRASAVGSPSGSGLRSYPAYLTGTQSISTVKIGTYNNEMSFMFTANGSETTKLSISIPPSGDGEPMTYDLNGLKNALQEAIDAKVGSGILRVTTVGSQLRIESAQITNECSIYDFEGDLFDKIFRKPQYAGVQNHLEKVGTTEGDNLTFIIGRNPMEPITQEELEAGKNVAIYPGLNDSFAFDFTYRDKTATIDLRIEQGVYTREELAEHLQTLARKRIDEVGYVEDDGDPLDSERFRITIGAQNLQLTDAEGGEVSIKYLDKLLVLSFKEYADGTVEKSDALIEGIRGTSAYKIFYEATKSPSPARLIGSVDISKGVTITGENSEINLMLNNEFISARLPVGTWSGEQITDMLNTIYRSKGTVVRTFITNNRLMFYTLDEGDYKIDKISGSAAQTLFYGGDSREEDDTELGIHTGRRTDSYVWLKKIRCDQHLMRINTTGVTTVDRALKAIARLDGANAYLTQCRALSGAYENRLEMTRERNTIQIENLENSESAIRDADIANEVANARKAQLVKQIQEFVISQERETARNNIMNTFG